MQYKTSNRFRYRWDTIFN